jgi:hypothetical protein
MVGERGGGCQRLDPSQPTLMTAWGETSTTCISGVAKPGSESPPLRLSRARLRIIFRRRIFRCGPNLCTVSFSGTEGCGKMRKRGCQTADVPG